MKRAATLALAVWFIGVGNVAGVARVRPERRSAASYTPGAQKSKRARSSRLYCVTAYCTTPTRTVLPPTSRGGTCAADLRLHPVGTRLTIAGRTYRVSGAHGKRGRVIDLWIPSRRACLKFGRQRLKVETITTTRSEDQ